jgi:acyl carrier protein
LSQAVESRVLEMAADVFGVEASELSTATAPDDLEEWDSFAQLNLLVALEDEYVIRFEPDEFGQMSSLGAVAELVVAKLP